MHRLIDLSLRNKFLVLILTSVMVGVGIYSMLRLPIDAVPDVTPNQVLILTQAPGLGPVEVERFITFPVETAMSGLPGITDIRSISRFGLSSVYIYFEEGMDLYFVRRLIMADDLATLPFAIGLSRRAARIIKQNLILSMTVIALLAVATLAGRAGIGTAVLLHEGSTMVVVANSLRLLGYKGIGS